MLDSVKDFFLTSSPEAFFFVSAALFAACLFSLWYTWRTFYRMRLITDTPTSLIRSAAQGYTEFDGYCEMMPGVPITSPLTRKEVVWYKFRVSERKRDSDGKGSSWRVINKGKSDSLFLLTDTTGECVIDPEGADVIGAKKVTWYGETPNPEYGPKAGSSNLLGTARYRYEEQIIQPAQAMYALGLFTTTGGSADEGPLADDIRMILAEWKKDPARMRLFDTDGNGKIDAEEWDQARDAARTEALQARSDRAAKPGTNLLLKPRDKRRPFILSVTPPEKLVTQFRWLMGGALIGFFILGMTFVWGINLRFGL